MTLCLCTGLGLVSASAADLSVKSGADKSDPMETVSIDAGLTLTKPFSAYGDFALVWAPKGLDTSGTACALPLLTELTVTSTPAL